MMDPAETPDQKPPDVIQATPEASRAFTWADARKLAIIFRDGMLMMVRGVERFFDLGKKSDKNNSQQ